MGNILSILEKIPVSSGTMLANDFTVRQAKVVKYGGHIQSNNSTAIFDHFASTAMFVHCLTDSRQGQARSSEIAGECPNSNIGTSQFHESSSC